MKRKSWYTKWFIYPFTIITILGILTWGFSKPIQVWIDNYSVRGLKEKLLNDFRPGNADSLISYLDSFSLNEYTKPVYANDIRISSRANWSLKEKFPQNLIEERLSFASFLTYLNPSDSAFFYIYKKNNFKNSKIILWVPGLGVSNLAFRFIKQFFITEIEKGYTVVVYVPPFHLDRKHPEKENGDGFITSNIQGNLQTQFEAVRELRTLLKFLEQKEPAEINAWGGSMGASFLLLTSQFYKFEHISLMIPMVDWEHTMLQNKELKSLLPDYAKYDIDSNLLARAFKTISPINYELNLPKQKTLIQLADYDQLTNKKKIIEFADKNGINNIKSYHQGHATILMNRKLYKDYDEFLYKLK